MIPYMLPESRGHLGGLGGLGRYFSCIYYTSSVVSSRIGRSRVGRHFGNRNIDRSLRMRSAIEYVLHQRKRSICESYQPVGFPSEMPAFPLRRFLKIRSPQREKALAKWMKQSCWPNRLIENIHLRDNIMASLRQGKPYLLGIINHGSKCSTKGFACASTWGSLLS